MGKWYKVCPYCANQIEENAIKCQFCNKIFEEDIKNNSDFDNDSQKRIIVVKLFIWIIIGILIVLLVCQLYYLVNQKQKKQHLEEIRNKVFSYTWVINEYQLEEYYRASIDYYWNTSSIPDSVIFWYLASWREKYDRKWDSLWNLYVDDVNEYKDIVKMNNLIRKRKIYKDYSDEMESELIKFMDVIWYSEKNGKNSFMQKIAEELYQSNKIADLNIEFLNFLITRQNNFYINNEWKLVFNNDNDLSKYNDFVHKINYENEIEKEMYKNAFQKSK